jgi:putative transcriptional regulator
MKKMDKTKKRLLEEAHEIAQDLHNADIISIKTMKEFDALCLPEIHELSASKIKKIRLSTGISQAVFAKVVNVSAAAIKQWERGERKPSGAALKLLNLIEEKGLESVL